MTTAGVWEAMAERDSADQSEHKGDCRSAVEGGEWDMKSTVAELQAEAGRNVDD